MPGGNIFYDIVCLDELCSLVPVSKESNTCEMGAYFCSLTMGLSSATGSIGNRFNELGLSCSFPALSGSQNCVHLGLTVFNN